MAKCIRFDEFRLDVSRRVLLRDNRRVALSDKPLGILIYLIENRSEGATTEEIVSSVWKGAVAGNPVPAQITILRKKLGRKEIIRNVDRKY